MSLTDWIATASLFVAAASLLVALFALRESRRTNRITLVDRRAAISDAFRELAIAALCQVPSIDEAELSKFEPYASSAEKYLPKRLSDEVATFFEDCQYLHFAQRLSKPVDPDVTARVGEAAARVHRNALRISNELLALVRQVADA